MPGPACRPAGLFAALALAACAQAPGAVAPVPVSAARYSGLTCGQLANEEARMNRVLADLTAEQNQSRSDDVLGYLTLLMPLASMSGGDLRHQIALHKGRREAVAEVLARKCPGGARL